MTASRRGLRSTILLSSIALVVPGSSFAIDLEKLVSPGDVIEGHADVEADCRRCHSPFERASEAALCLDCHAPVAADLQTHTGFHGLQPAESMRSCRGCHGEHQGREADIVGLDAEIFDHGSTDYPLAGAHQRVDCAGCHQANQKHREAPGTCIGCHSEDDAHQGQLGEDCSECHSELEWREARFDHDRTKFPLDGGHVGVDCALCHPARKYEGTVESCQGCHAVDDVHQGRFGQECADCHETAAWKRGAFDHTGKTRFPLRGKHRKATCESCHSGSAAVRKRPGSGARVGELKLDTRCVACHGADDEHRGTYGQDCADCHDAADWRRVRFDHRRDAKFALPGGHGELPCGSCHRGKLGEEKLARDCFGCHAADDVHRGQQGERCESCHDASSWTGKVLFDHELTRFPLLGLHGVVPCEECHQTLAFQDAPQDCSECHAENDVHESSLGSDCMLCHNPNGWQLWRFDHERQTRFALHGAHENLDCRGCHDSPAKHGIKLETGCESCHGRDDAHRGSFGLRCEDCHLDTSWKELRIGH